MREQLRGMREQREKWHEVDEMQGISEFPFHILASNRMETRSAHAIDRSTGGRGHCLWQTRWRMAERSTFENFGRRVDAQFGKVGPRVEDEVKRVITYLNDQVVPQVRQNSSSALRMAAEQLGRLADYLEEGRKAQGTADAPQAGEQKSA
jgi:hypothetical protein